MTTEHAVLEVLFPKVRAELLRLIFCNPPKQRYVRELMNMSGLALHTVQDELRKLKTVVQKHGGRNFKYYASMTSGTPNRLFMYEIDKLAHFDTLSTDPDFRAVKLDSLYTDATGTTWAEVPL